CTDCKRRKVKCDETYPACFHCTRLGLPCSLASFGPSKPNNIPQRQPARRSFQTTATPATSSLARSGCGFNLLPFDALSDRLRKPPLVNTVKIWDRGLELIHHYSIETCNTLSLRSDMQYVWKITIPRVAYSNPFVMHGILALSAAYKAHLIPSQRETYLNIAAYHQLLGVTGFRAALQAVEEDTWQSIFCFSSLVVLYSFSLPACVNDPYPPGPAPDIFEPFVLARGIQVILRSFNALIRKTRFAPLVNGIWTVDEDDPSFLPSL
ncbi:hypothetical protein B0J13DRAFT_392497, partial [Dactylonectria estremocensis]